MEANHIELAYMIEEYLVDSQGSLKNPLSAFCLYKWTRRKQITKTGVSKFMNDNMVINKIKREWKNLDPDFK